MGASTDEERPIPRLALAFPDSIRVADLDLGEGDTYTVSRSAGKPVDFAVSLREGVLYWMNELQEIFVSKLDGTGHSKVLHLCYLNVKFNARTVNCLNIMGSVSITQVDMLESG